MPIATPKLVEINLEDIRPNPLNVRLEDSLKSVDKLAESIRTEGLIHPVLLRPCAETQGFELICGERRYRAFCLLAQDDAEFNVIPARVTRADDATALALMHRENIERADWTQYEKALFYKQAYESGAFSSLRVTASSLGIGTTTLHRYLKVFELPQKIVKKFAADEYGLAQMELFIESPQKLHKQLATGFAQGWTKNQARYFIAHGETPNIATTLAAHGVKHKTSKDKITLTIEAENLEAAIEKLRPILR